MGSKLGCTGLSNKSSICGLLVPLFLGQKLLIILILLPKLLTSYTLASGESSFEMKQLDVVVSPPACVWNPYLMLTHVTFDLEPCDLWPRGQISMKSSIVWPNFMWLPAIFFVIWIYSSLNFFYRQTDRKWRLWAHHAACTGGPKKATWLVSVAPFIIAHPGHWKNGTFFFKVRSATGQSHRVAKISYGHMPLYFLIYIYWKNVTFFQSWIRH